ncbi:MULTISPECIES: rhodanese-like domain-containing protein [unclassified Streptomyces]|uniref:rhodanese-like domain-containing protein n=1 Tax=unclassified Streptomyces TaxID=2593676 RepID=UPI001F0347F1|nr:MULTISPECIES: rhodanese-like domain-containing protein [unclassified Streptomyces]MCH0566680.1 rhodanese-like domain-containing protein [Streptomyces sp. MUM 2J]MCH0572226.1 rhodanese-like domain-containing protein [Streptomyces sp. MUM 136J]
MSIFRRRTGGAGRVTVQEAAARTGHGRSAADGADAVLLDVREPYEWRAGHVPGAVHLPLAALSAGTELPGEAQARPVVVICRSGNRSQRAAELLVSRGTEAVDVIGGMRDWAAAGLPVVDGRGRTGTIA